MADGAARAASVPARSSTASSGLIVRDNGWRWRGLAWSERGPRRASAEPSAVRFSCVTGGSWNDPPEHLSGRALEAHLSRRDFIWKSASAAGIAAVAAGLPAGTILAEAASAKAK